MRYTAQERMQVEAIKNPKQVYAFDFGDLVLLADRHQGPYIKKQDLILDINKLVHVKTDTVVDPATLKACTVPATRTRQVYVLDNDKMAVKLQADDTEAWVNLKWLDSFGTGLKYRISGKRSPVLKTDRNDYPVGMILPVDIKGGADR